ncbi:MAG: GrpB family protein [Chlamydiales bacterium]|nr:GrpB family protein [Chlamydiales bacterium]
MEINGVIEIAPYNPNWPRSYEVEAEKIKGALGKNCVTIYHIGSTSVPGLAAKPIIDIMVVVKDIFDVDANLLELEDLGYIAKGENGIPFRRFFHKGIDLHTHHIHIYEEGSPEIERYLHFKNYLKANPDVSQEYESLKVFLAKQYPHDLTAYSNGKDAFIHEIDQKANINKLHIVVACSAREWQSVTEFRRQYSLQSKKECALVKDHHSHIILLQGANFIGYADILLPYPEMALLTILILKSGYEKYRQEFINLLERWLLHQGRQLDQTS